MRDRRSASLWVSVALTLLLGACAAVPRQPPSGGAPLSWPQRETQLGNWTQFEATGRISSAELGGRGDFRWTQHDAGHFDLQLAGPFGAGAVQLTVAPEGARIASKEGEQFTPDAEQWLRQRMGVTLPVRALRYWLLGLPLPERPAHTQFDSQGRLAQLVQDGWTLDYMDYQNTGSAAQGIDLPRRFDASNGSLRLRLIVDSWTSPDPRRDGAL